MVEKQYVVDCLGDILKGKYFLVDVKVSSDSKIRVYLDTFSGITLSECKEIHKELYAEIEKKEINFELEISSPGLTGNLRVWQQFKKNENKEINVTKSTGENINVLVTYADTECIKVKDSRDNEITLTYEEIRKAKPIIKF